MTYYRLEPSGCGAGAVSYLVPVSGAGWAAGGTSYMSRAEPRVDYHVVAEGVCRRQIAGCLLRGANSE